MAVLTGVVGSITWHYFTAAAVNGYTVTRDKETKRWAVRGTLVLADAYKLAQRPLVFVATHPGGAWYWPILEPVPPLTQGPFALTLGPPIAKGSALHVDSRAPAGDRSA